MYLSIGYTYGKPGVSQKCLHWSMGTYTEPEKFHLFRMPAWVRGAWRSNQNWDCRLLWWRLSLTHMRTKDTPDEYTYYGRATCTCCQGVGWHLTNKDGSPPLRDALGDGRNANACLGQGGG